MATPETTPDAPLADVDAILDVLFETADPALTPPRRCWLVLDGARDDRIATLVANSGHPHASLYRGEMEPRLAALAPWLVELPHRDDPWLRLVLELGWGRAWGIFLDSAAPFANVQRHLRSFLRVKDEDGRRLLFRYYDPRVLRVYLPTTNADETFTFTGPIRRFLCEAPGGACVFVDEPVQGAFVRRVVPLAAPAASGLAAAS